MKNKTAQDSRLRLTSSPYQAPCVTTAAAKLPPNLCLVSLFHSTHSAMPLLHHILLLHPTQTSFSTFYLFFFFCSFSSPFRKMYLYHTRAKCSSRDLMNKPNRHMICEHHQPHLSAWKLVQQQSALAPLESCFSPWDKICSSCSKVQTFVNRLRFAFFISFPLYSSQL